MTAAPSTTALADTIAAATVRKIRRRLILFLFTIFVIAFVDRINIGFAALTMNKDLAIASQQFGFLSGIFFFGYFLFEVPSNYLLHKIGARVWIARILLTWGLIATLTGFVQNVHQLYVMRFLLGVAEAGYFPGIVLYLTYWFRQRDMAQTAALFIAALPVTSIVGAPISGMILDHVHWLGLSSWRWLLVLEGLPAVLFGVLTYLTLPNGPADARFLDSSEKTWLLAELKSEEEQKLVQRHYSVAEALTNRRVWHLTFVYFGIMVGGYAFQFWGPQILKSTGAGYSNVAVGLWLMIVNLVGLAAMLLVSRSSDRRLERRFHVAVPAVLGGMALFLLGAPHNAPTSVILLSLLAVGVYSSLSPFWAMPNEFLAGYSAAVGIALINSCGNLGGFAGPYVIGAIARRTGSIYPGLAVCGIPMLVAGALVVFLSRRQIQESGSPLA
jgi:ACS family tartrate transporter-like MFS transporter